MLVQFLKKNVHGQRQRVGVLVADKVSLPEGEFVAVGWAQCNCKADSFDPQTALEMAVGRAKGLAVPRNRTNTIPHLVKQELPEFNERCKRYFKTNNLVVYTPVVK